MSVRGKEATEAGTPERRASGGQRVPFEALVAVGDGPRGGFEAESVDVSVDGMRLRTAYLPAEGEKLVCRFDGMGTEVVVDGEVLWRREEAKGGEFGVRFVGLDEATSAAVRAMCMTLGDPGEEEPAANGDQVAKGSRVRLHIEGLGSPMKARVRNSAAKELSVGSNLEFLKVGRALELEDVEQGQKREAIIDDVKVDVDPATNVPQLVVTLRFEKAGAAGEKPRSRTSETKSSEGRSSEKPRKPAAAAAVEAKGAGEADESDEEGGDSKSAAAAKMLHRAGAAGQAALTKVGPALAGAGQRAKTALDGVLGLVKRRQVERAEAKKASAPRRTTAPPPTGALTSEGRRLVRDRGEEEEETDLPPRGTRRAAAMGGALGLLVVLAIFAAVRVAGRNHTAAATAQSGATPVAALPTAEPVAAAPGTPTANVPLFGATPLSTTEPAAGATPTPSASAVADAPPSGEDDDPPADGTGATKLKEWGAGSVAHPVVLKIKMDGAIERISGAAGAMGFTISVPNRRSLLPSSTDLAHKDKRLSSVNVVNTSHGAEITVQFKDGVPPYLAKVKGDRLEIAIGKEGKVAKSKKKKKSKRHDDE